MPRWLGRLLWWAAVAATVGFFLLPVVWMVGTAFKPPGDYVSATPRFLPSALTLEHLRALLAEGFPRRLGNTALVALGATLVSLVCAFPAAYALVRLRFPARLDTVFLLLVLVIKLMPPIVVGLPLYETLGSLGLRNNLLGLVLVYQLYTLPFCVWMLLGFVREVPMELEEAAIMDGAGLGRRLIEIVLPCCAPGVVAAAILAMVLCWNEFLFALLYLESPGRFTLPLYIATFITENETFWGELMGIGLLSSLPVLLLAGGIQRHLLRGLGGR